MKAAFIDRDGVINEERGYVWRAEDFRLLPGVVDGLKVLQENDWKLVVVTNQAGIARGYYGESDYRRLTEHMAGLLAAEGVRLDGIYHCPHHPTASVGAYRADCQCRKPRPGMLLAAAHDLELTLAESVMIGDKWSDIEAGIAAGVSASVLVESGHATDARTRALATHACLGLADAAEWVVGHARTERRRPPRFEGV